MKHNSYIAPILFILIGLSCMGYSLASASGFHTHSDIWFKEYSSPLILFIVITISLICICLLKRKQQVKNKQK